MANSSPIILGFGYKMRRGKDTAVDAIIQARGGKYDIRRYAFADALREEVLNAAFDRWMQERPSYPYPGGVETLDEAIKLGYASVKMARLSAIALLCQWAGVPFDPDAEIEPNYPLTKQRALLQWWGTEYRRSKDNFYWVNKLRQRVERERPQFALITDMRFRNEVSYVLSCEGYTVRVDRQVQGETHTVHKSEIELDSAPESVWTHRLNNSGDLEDFKTAAVNMFDQIVKSLECPLIDDLLSLVAA